MKKAPVIILLACISLLHCSCNKFSIGDITSEVRHLNEPFQIVEIRDDIDVSLRRCNADTAAGTICIKTGENLIEAIHAQTEDVMESEGGDTLSFTKLIITNDNTYNFLRPYDHTPQMTVYYDTLFKLIFHSNARNIRTDTFLQQARDFKMLDYDAMNKVVKFLSIADESHPWTVMRSAELLKWIDSGEYNRFVSKSYIS